MPPDPLDQQIADFEKTQPKPENSDAPSSRFL